MDNEDDILNVDFDPHDLENVDEDALLGRLTPPIFKSTRIPVEFETKNETQTAISIDRKTETSRFVTDDDDSDDEIRGKSHDKFKTEQCSTAPKRIRSDRRDIPENLDDVKIPQQTLHQDKAAFNRKSADKRRFIPNNRNQKNHRGKVLLNPHFKGTITADANVRLAWDIGHHRMPIHLNKVTIMHGHHSSRPFDNKPMSLVGPPLHFPPPSMQAVLHTTVRPLMSVTGGIPYPPPGVAKSVPPPLIPSSSVHLSRLPPPPANLNRPPPANLNRPPPANLNRPPPANINHPPPTNLNRPPPANLNGPPPGNLNRPPPSLFATDVPPPRSSQQAPTGIKPLMDFSRPPPFQQMVSSSCNPIKNDWLGATEDFLRRLQTNSASSSNGNSSGNSGGGPFRVSRERQAAASIRRKYGIRSSDRLRNSVESNRPNVHDYQYPTVDSYHVIDLHKDPVDDDYLKKLEEQKRLRDELNKRKEIRRQQEIAQKQKTSSNGSGVQPEPAQKSDNLKRSSSDSKKRDQLANPPPTSERIVKPPRRV